MKVLRSFAKKSANFVHPTMAESFGERLDKKIGDKYLDPYGFLEETDYKDYEVDSPEQKIKTEESNKSEAKITSASISEAPEVLKISEKKESDIPEEFGFKAKGPEPTRFGDWQHKGRCTDF